MTYLKINDFELEVIQAAKDGKTANFLSRKDPSGNPIKVVIQSGVIRNLLLGLPLPGKANDLAGPFNPQPISSAGVRVRGASISGVIDISDTFEHDGNGCAPLLLEDCVLLGDGTYDDPAERPRPALDAKHVRISRLVLKNCRAGFIDLTDAEILSDLDIEGLQSLSEGGQCRVEAKGIRIDGSLIAADVKLRLKQERLDKTEATIADYALNLSGADIAGSVELRPGFVADGGISIWNAWIKGDLWADGAHLIAQGNQALRAQSAQVDGVVGLTCLFTRSPITETEVITYSQPVRFHAEGAITFIGANLGALMMKGALLRRKSEEKDNWLACNLAEIKQTVALDQWQYQDEQGYSSLLPFEAHYGVWFEGTKIQGTLNATGAKFHDSGGFTGANLQVSGDVILSTAQAGNVSLQGARIASDLMLAQMRCSSLNAQDIKVEGSVYWSGELSGMGNFRGACIEGELYLGFAEYRPLHLVKHEGLIPHVSFEDANVNRDLKIKGVRVSQINRLEWTKYQTLRVRAKKLQCYEHWQLCEALFEPQADDVRGFAVISFMMDLRNGAMFFLDGLSDSIYGFNVRGSLCLETDGQISDYLKFFCAHVWADLGAFRIVESGTETSGFTQTPAALATQVTPVTIKGLPGSPWQAEANVLFAQELYKTSFLIHPNGMVEMTEDQSLAYLEGDPIVTYIAPVRIIRPTLLEQSNNPNAEKAAIEPSIQKWSTPPAIDSPDSWVEVPEKRVNELKKKIIELVEFRASPMITPDDPKPTINLKGFKVGSLDDNHGMNWGDGLVLDLEGFEYARFEATETAALKAINVNFYFTQRQKGLARKGLRKTVYRMTLRWQTVKTRLARPQPVWRHRIEWLNKQYTQIPPKRTEYKPQPYEQLARVFRSEGNHGFALQILIEKLRLERHILSRFSPRRLGAWFLDRMFGYGLLWVPVFRTFLLAWVIGWAGVEIANQGHLNWPVVGSQGNLAVPFLVIQQPVLVVDAVPVSTLALTDDSEETINSPTAREAVTSSPSGRLVKEIRCGDQIEPALYSLDVFVPLLDLKQESKCTVSARQSAWPWRVSKSAYAILGWIITSALILTITGVIRRQAER